MLLMVTVPKVCFPETGAEGDQVSWVGDSQKPDFSVRKLSKVSGELRLALLPKSSDPGWAAGSFEHRDMDSEGGGGVNYGSRQ